MKKLIIIGLLLTQQVMAYDFPTEWTPYQYKETPQFCPWFERTTGFPIDAITFPDRKTIYGCFEETDSAQWKKEATWHEYAHNYTYDAMSKEAQTKFWELFNALTKHNEQLKEFDFENDYSSKNADEFVAEYSRMVKFGQYEANGKLEEKLWQIFEKMNKSMEVQLTGY